MRVNSIRSKIVLGFLACIAVTVIAFGVILTVALDFRQADALSRSAVEGSQTAAASQKATQAAETALMQYLSAVNGANSKELADRLEDLIRVDPAYKALADEAQAASRLIENAQIGVISIANMVNALSAPTMTIGEAAANLGDAAIMQAIIKYNQSYAQVASNVGRVFALQDNGAAEFVVQNLGRMESNLAEVVGQPTATPRIKKLGAAIDRDSKALATAFADYRKLVRQRDDAMTRLKQSLGAVSDAAAVKAAQAAEDYGRTQRVAETATTRLMLSLFAGAPAVLIIGLVLAFSIGRSISRPVVALSGTVEKIATGNYEIDVPGQARGDEIGQMAKAVQVLKEGAIERRRLQAEQSREAEARLRRAEMIDTLLRDFATDSTRVIEGFRRAAGDLDGMARKLAENSSDTSARAMATSAAATQASTNVVAVARAAEQLRLSIEEINTKVTGSAAAADRASTLAGDTVRTIAELAEAGTEIGEVVSLITAVASQTNLLALNATIEAARAGEAGRGFAVVATEVKNLAAQTTAATAQISEKVARIQNITMAASGAVEAIRNAISDIDQMSGGIAAAMTEQGAATDEIARGMGEAAKGTEDVTANIAMVSSRADDVRDASRHSLDATAELAAQASHLSGRIDDFLGRIRAA